MMLTRKSSHGARMRLSNGASCAFECWLHYFSKSGFQFSYLYHMEEFLPILKNISKYIELTKEEEAFFVSLLRNRRGSLQHTATVLGLHCSYQEIASAQYHLLHRKFFHVPRNNAQW
jgi:hypothetical protein